MQFLFRSVRRGHESSFIAEEESRPSRANEKERERKEKIERERKKKRGEEEEKEKGRRRISLERNFKSGGVGKWGRGSWWSVVLGVVPFVERQ